MLLCHYYTSFTAQCAKLWGNTWVGDPPCSLRRWKRGDPSRLFLNELRRVLQWAELLAAIPPPPPGLEGGVKESEPTPTPPPSAREEEEEEEEEGGVAGGWWGWCTGVPRGVGRGEPWGVTWDTGYKLLVIDLSIAGKNRKRGMGDRRGEGEGEREEGECRGRDFMDCRWGLSEGALDGSVWVLDSWERAGRGVVTLLPGLVAAETSDWLKVNTGLWWRGVGDGGGEEGWRKMERKKGVEMSNEC